MDDLDEILETLTEAAKSLAAQFTTIWVPIQLALILLATLIGWGIAILLRRRIDLVSLTMGWPLHLRRAARVIIDNLGIVLCILMLVLFRAAMQATMVPSRYYLVGVAAKLATAWIVIAVLASLIRNQFVNGLVSAIAWSIAALSILGLLEPVRDALDSTGMVIGGLRITALLALKTTALLLLALWLATLASNFLDSRVKSFKDLTPSIQVLLGKLIRIGLITFAVLVVLSSVGIDFSALALFSGAVGVGVGFGLQKIVSNLVSGIILLADKSIKPGDVISLGETYGWVETMGARYIAVVSRDGREYLIPNEDFVTQRVINWTYTKDDVRLTVEFGVDVVADPHMVRRVAIEAAATVPRVLDMPPPVCHFMGFGSKSLDFSLRFWIRDPVAGATNVKSAVRLAIWDAFKREGIPLPPPVQDLRFVEPVRVEGTPEREPG
jgi:small-conductance mechanosensitive channel